MSERGQDKRYLLSTLVAVAGVNPITFNSWRQRNGLFPWSLKAKGWKQYSASDICVAYCVNGLIKSGCTAQFAVDAAMMLLPRFEEMWTSDSVEAFDNCIALISIIDHGSSDKSNIEIDIEFHDPSKPILEIIRGRLGWGTAQIVDLYDVMLNVIRSLKALQPETVMTPEETRSFVFSSLAKAIAETRTDEED
ncbi:hypothetical protein ACO2RV_10365 [Ancylobacter sp. VNQ12]|uniref:hypothetical protein n=1 Tax=Ancylobacter sp. VNQ12 TaxID=3400920 RepID=UPI003C04E12C